MTTMADNLRHLIGGWSLREIEEVLEVVGDALVERSVIAGKLAGGDRTREESLKDVMRAIASHGRRARDLGW